MTSRTLSKPEWQSYCDRVSKSLEGMQAQVEIVGLAVGNQKLTAKWVPLLGIVYDPKGDLVEIALEGLDHLISGPLEISVNEGPRGLESMEIIDADQVRQIVKLTQPLGLPAR
jgi:hypothetical protein